jgi:AcrR family transcriptional regulator
VTKGAQTRQTILRSAVETAFRVGLGGLTIGQLAESTGMSKSGLFAHFRSKELLQVEVLRAARGEFVEDVVRPALQTPRGEPRVRELFERWLARSHSGQAGVCLFVKASTELDEQDGPVRDELVREHLLFMELLGRVFTTGIDEGHFAADADPDQFATDLNGVMLAHYHAHRLLEDPGAEHRARRAFENLLDAARPRPA